MPNQISYTIFKVKWGFFGLLVSENVILRTSLPTQNPRIAKKDLLVGITKTPVFNQELYPHLQKLITAYFNGSYIKFNNAETGPILQTGSDFRKKILKTCRKIKFGQTITYSQLAARAGFPRAARAAGSVLAKNPFPLIIPCHRIIKANGQTGQFSAPGGTKTKKQMLNLEKP